MLTSNDLYLTTKYQYSLNKVKLIGNLTIHQLFNRLEQNNQSSSQQLFFINPSLGIDYKINNNNRIRTSYAHNRTIWVSQPILEGVGDGYLRKARCKYKNLLSTGNHRQDFLPDVSKSWRWGYKDGMYYYDYDRIPNNAPKHYKDTLPSESTLLDMGRGLGLHKAVSECLIVDKLQAKVKTLPINDMVGYIMDSDRFYKKGRGTYPEALKIAKKKAWCDLLLELVGSSGYIALGIASQKQLWEVACVAANADGWTMKNPNSLRLRLREYAECKNSRDKINFFLGKYANDYARKIGKEEVVDTDTGEVIPYDAHKIAMFGLMTNLGEANKQFKKQLHKKYESLLLKSGMQPASYRSFCRYTSMWCNKMNISLEKDGFKHYNDNYLSYVSAQPVRYANSMWVADGSSSKLGYLDEKTGRIKGLYVVWVFDVATKKVMGYSFGRREHEQMVLDAFAKAFKTSNQLRPMEILTDNGSSFSGQKDKLSKMSPYYHTITAGNSQENPAETLIKLHINSCRDCANWLYSSFHAKTETSKGNPDNIKANKRRYPTYEAVQLQVMDIVTRWNSTKGLDGLSPNERYDLFGVNKNSKPISVKDSRFVFGNRTTVDVSYMRSFVNVEKQGKAYQYDIPNVKTLEKINKMTGYKGDAKVVVCSDAAVADLYTAGGLFITSCARVEKAHKTYSEATKDSHKALENLRKKKQDQLMEAVKFTEDIKQGFEALYEEEDPMPYGTLAGSMSKVKDAHNDLEEAAFNQQIDNQPKTSVLPNVSKGLQDFYS